MGPPYDLLRTAFHKRYEGQLSKVTIQTNLNECWKELKAKFKDPNELANATNEKIHALGVEATEHRTSAFMSLFRKVPPKTNNATDASVVQPAGDQSGVTEPVAGPSGDTALAAGPLEDPEEDPDDPRDPEATVTLKRKYAAPAQSAAKEKIQALESNLTKYVLARDLQLTDAKEAENKIKNTTKQIKSQQQLLRNKELNAQYQSKYRAKVKAALKSVRSDDNSVVIGLRSQSGRPRLEESEPGLLQAIMDIAIHGSAAHDRRRTEEVRCCRTLTDLTAKLEEMGINISRSATYLRLMPRNPRSLQAMKHVVTVPVKLSRPSNDLHKSHPDGKFCTTSIRYLETLASLLGPQQVSFLSQDDKARVPIGMTAAKEQSPLLMHVDYRVTLPDHNWVVGEKHKLIPSVYAGCVIKPHGNGSPEAVTYSGPTYVAIRSGKHSSSTAATHAHDLSKLFQLGSFRDILKIGDLAKPILIISVDGGPDENPRYPKTISFAAKHFKEHDLDALYVVTNAPHRSAFNRVERRMAPLSRQLSGVILPHDSFGSHLDNNGKTIDADLEIQNFEAAGKVLAEIWSDITIDSHPVLATFESSSATVEVPELPQDVNPMWYAQHVRESQYFLQVVKCDDLMCCGPNRSDLRTILPMRFLPPPIKIVQDAESGLRVCSTKESPDGCHFLPLFQRLSLQIRLPAATVEDMAKLQYDYSCPSVASDLKRRTCQVCGLYFASIKAADIHSRSLHPSARRTAAIRRNEAAAAVAATEVSEPAATEVSEPAAAAGAIRRSSRIAAQLKQRGDEVLCRTVDDETGAEDCEWIPEDEIPLISLRTPTDRNSVEEIECLPDWLSGPWREEN